MYVRVIVQLESTRFGLHGVCIFAFAQALAAVRQVRSHSCPCGFGVPIFDRVVNAFMFSMNALQIAQAAFGCVERERFIASASTDLLYKQELIAPESIGLEA